MHISKVKLSGGDYSRLVDHMEREHLYYKSNVDLSKSSMNITLKPYERALEGFIRAQGVKRVRKDSIGALNVVCTVSEADRGYLERDSSRYERWGWAVIDSTLKTLNLKREDVLGAVIHRDETSPHIQFSLAPLVREKDKVRLSAKEVANKEAFTKLHDNLQVEMKRKGFKGQYVNEDKALRGVNNETLEGFKKSQEAIQKTKKEAFELTFLNHSLKQENAQLLEQKNKLMEELNPLKMLESLIKFASKITMKVDGTNLLDVFNNWRDSGEPEDLKDFITSWGKDKNKKAPDRSGER